MSGGATRILVVDDAVEYARMIGEFIRMSEPEAVVDVADGYESALGAFGRSTYDVALFDYWLGSRDGLALLREIRARGFDTPVVVMTGRGAEEVAVDAMKAGACDYLSKAAVTPEALAAAIRHAQALSAEERQRRQAEKALRANEERFRALVENSSDALLLVDRQGRVTYVTPSVERTLGWQGGDVLGRSVFDVLHADDREYVSARMTDILQRPGQPVGAEVRLRHADGSWRNMEAVAVNRLREPAVNAIVINARDVTERRRLEDQLRQSQKMEAVGRLAGGVAHDYNNLLTAILGYANLVLDELPADSPLRTDLEEIRAAGDRAASLTRQLLAFSRRQMLLPQVVNLNAVIQQMDRALARLMGDDVDVSFTLAPDLRTVRVDPSSIEQVLLNLAINARDAMPRGGRLSIETANVNVASLEVDTHAAMPPGQYVVLAVGDNGAGMDEATRVRIFEPFFTTKEQGKGIGLGLATVYGIVKQSGGYIWVFSEPDQGTVFKLYLPPVVVPALARMCEPETDGTARGWETVLLVEDQDAVRALAREVLRRRGYVVLEARHGLDALRIAERHGDPIHLLITDIAMPHMNGRELAERMANSRSDLKVLFLSTFAGQEVTDASRPSVSFLQKPFTPDSLIRRVRQMLGAKESAMS